MKRLDSKGFSAVEGLLILVIVGVISGVGYYVYQAQNKSVATVADNTADNEELEATPEPEASDSKEFESKIGYAITPPEGSTTVESKDAKSYDGFYLKSTDEKAQYGMAIYWRDTDTQTEGTPEGYRGIDTNRKLEITTVAGLPAVRVTDDSALHATYWIYNATKTKVVRVSIVGESEAEFAAYKQSLETLRWL